MAHGLNRAAAISLVFNLQHVPAGMARWGAAVPPRRRACRPRGTAAPSAPGRRPAAHCRSTPTSGDDAGSQPATRPAPCGNSAAGGRGPAQPVQPRGRGGPDRRGTSTGTPRTRLGSRTGIAPRHAGSRFRRGGSPAAVRPADGRWPAGDRRRARPGHRPQRTLRPATAGRLPRPGPRLRPPRRRRRSSAQAGRSHAPVTNEEREGIREAARRYVHEQAPTPPVAVLERVARIVLQARTQPGGSPVPFSHATARRPTQHDADGSPG
jgi:hypothetical protein